LDSSLGGQSLKILAKILGIASAVCYLLIAAVLFIAAPLAGGYKPVVVLTGSMEPAFSPGSVIYYKTASFESIQKGDIISFSKNDDARSMVTHRVDEVNAKRREFWTKGDANEDQDPRPVSFADVRGKVMNYHLPFVGYGVQYIQNSYVIGAVFIILLAKLIVDRIDERYKKSERKTV
jgi:signal peptidase I